MMSLLTPAIYLIHAAVLLSGLLWLRRLHESGRIEAVSRNRLALLAAGLGLLMLGVAEPLRGPFQDFVDAYYFGGKTILSGAWDAAALFRNDVHGFVNVPIVAVLFVPFAILPGRAAALVFLGLGIAAVLLTWRLLVRLAGLDRYRGYVLLLLMIVNGPLMNSLKEGNTSHFTLLAMTLALVLLRDKPYRAGALLALAAIFKLPLALYGLWLLLRGRLRALLAMSGVLAVTGLASVAVFGVGAHLTWYERFVASAAERPIAAFNVQSFPAFFVRWSRAPEVLCNWQGLPAPEIRALASLVGLALIAGCVLAALWPALRRRRTGVSGASGQLGLEFAMVGMLACCTSPLAWSHYYCWALLPIALTLEATWSAARTGRIFRATWCAAVILLSLPVAWPWCTPSGPLASLYTVFASHYLLGGVVLLVLLAIQRASDGTLAAERA
jgi:hypothetical protein